MIFGNFYILFILFAFAFQTITLWQMKGNWKVYQFTNSNLKQKLLQNDILRDKTHIQAMGGNLPSMFYIENHLDCVVSKIYFKQKTVIETRNLR